jgi:hypothetical protein
MRMKIIAMERQQGKTTELVKMSAQSGDYIVTKDHSTARYTVEIARKLGLNIPFPLTFDEFIRREWNGRFVNGFLIDDAELLLLYMLYIEKPIHAMTISTGDVYGPEG